jgi:hypothetical protein
MLQATLHSFRGCWPACFSKTTETNSVAQAMHPLKLTHSEIMVGKVSGKIVRVSDVEPVPAPQSLSGFSGSTPTVEWLRKKGEQYLSLAYYENMQVNNNSGSSAVFLATFMCAYNEHKDIVLACDDVWTVIILHCSKYVNAHAEQLRPMLVPHAGSKPLSVTTWNQRLESQWEEFFKLMETEIRENSNPGVVDTFQSTFSTTGAVEKLLSTAVVMNTMKSFFSYARFIPSCGIRHAVLLGSLEDWQRLLEKVRGLGAYAVSPEWTTYISHLEPVLEQFINTYNGDVDRGFWDKVMNIECGSLGSGSTTYITGWVLAFYGMHGQKVELSDLADPYIDVPVLIDNQLTGVKKQSYIVGGFGGVCEVREQVTSNEPGDAQSVDVNGYRPQMSFVVCTDGVNLNARAP